VCAAKDFQRDDGAKVGVNQRLDVTLHVCRKYVNDWGRFVEKRDHSCIIRN